MHEEKKKPNDVRIEKRALGAADHLQSAKIRNDRAEKNLHKLLKYQDASSGTDRMRRTTIKIYSALRIQHVRIARKDLESVYTCGALKPAVICHFEVLKCWP